MNITHLNDTELDLAVLGEELPLPAAEHLASCVVCRRRRDGFLAVVSQMGGDDPDQATRARVRERALTAWGGARTTAHWLRWAAAAAALVVLVVLPLLTGRTPAPAPARFDAEAVLTEVNTVLDSDPLAAVVPEDVVNTVVPVPHAASDRSVAAGERSVS